MSFVFAENRTPMPLLDDWRQRTVSLIAGSVGT
jgi:hypothetical protein